MENAMIELIRFSDEYKAETIDRITHFFGYHSCLLANKTELTEKSYEEAGKTLLKWLSEGHELYMIRISWHRCGISAFMA